MQMECIGADPLYLDDQISTMYPLLKTRAIEASASVVGLHSRLGEVEIFRCSGFVIESESCNGKFISRILTTASILRPQPHIDEVRNDMKIFITLSNDVICQGTLSAVNFHYNIGILEIETDSPTKIARLRFIDDAITIDPNDLDENPPEYDNYESGKYKLFPGRTVVALGRKGNKRMVAAGKYSLALIGLDCQELFRANIQIPKHGIGGPLINSHGEVIGINFFDPLCTPFLPINIASMWWEQFKKKGTCRVPHLGMLLTNLYMFGTPYLENVRQQFPNTFKGVVIHKITSKSLALTEILRLDIIVKCDEKPVGSILEFFELIWQKVGEPVDLTVLRFDGLYRRATVNFDEVGPPHMYKWPLGDVWKCIRRAETCDYHFVRDLVKNSQLRVSHVSSADQLADALTKSLSRTSLSHLMHKIGITERAPS